MEKNKKFAAMFLIAVLMAVMSVNAAFATDCNFCYSGWIYNGNIPNSFLCGVNEDWESNSGDRYFCADTGVVQWYCNDGGPWVTEGCDPDVY